jgi:hypothetical protein
MNRDDGMHTTIFSSFYPHNRITTQSSIGEHFMSACRREAKMRKSQMGSHPSVCFLQKRFYEATHPRVVRGPLPEPPDPLRRRRETDSRLPPDHLAQPPSKVSRRDPEQPGPSPLPRAHAPAPPRPTGTRRGSAPVSPAHDVMPRPEPCRSSMVLPPADSVSVAFRSSIGWT